MRIYIVLVEVITFALVALFIVSQVLVPAVRGTALFPFFSRERKLKDAIVDAKQDLREDALEDMLDDLRKEHADTQPTEEKEQPK